MMLIQVRHNMEVAHRLSKTPGKCQQIHGHSMWIELTLIGDHVDDRGMICNAANESFEYGDVKKVFRDWIDRTYDHKLLLNKEDPYAQPLDLVGIGGVEHAVRLPGLVTCEDDPTIENLARWIAEWTRDVFRCSTNVKLQETHVNAAVMGATWEPIE
jgi:6-pyruvoyltetrahydropterin/6-carboxytetrahydropterin synthase